MKKIFIVLVPAAVMLLMLGACGSVPFIALQEPTATATATRRVRPTFTPKPNASPTSEQPTETLEPTGTATPEVTDTPEATETTAKPTSPPSKPRATTPPQPTAVPKPQFSVNVTSQYLCDQQGVYKLIINIKRGRTFAGGLVFGAFDAGGRLLQDGAGKNLLTTTIGDINVSIGSNCRQSADFVSPNSSNGELDVGDAVRAGTDPIYVRFVKSPTDMSPLSADIPVNFGKGGQYWMYLQVQ